MTHTQFVEFHDRGFWAYDVALGVFLKHLIDAAERRHDEVWLSEVVSRWRVVATVSEYGLTIEPSWSSARVTIFVELVEEACARLSERHSIPADEIRAWRILEHQGVFPRGAAAILTAPVIELGRAIIALAKGELPEAPPGTTWFYGTPTGRSTL